MKMTRLMLLAMLAALTGCASQGDLTAAREDIDSIKMRLFTVEKDLTGIRNESKEGIGVLEKNFRTDVAAVRKISADIQATIDSTKTDMQALNGRIDDMGTSIKKPAEDLDRYRSDADKRIIALEDRILKQQALLDELTKKMEEVNPTKKDGSGQAATTPDALYHKGLDIFKAGDMPAARDTLSKFLEQNPQHDLAANAHYWIGETHYSEKSYEPAILAFQEVIKNYPKKDKVPAAMLKQAMAFNAIKDTKSAKYVLKKLTESFPRSEEAKRAKEMLKEIR
jgi:tol-pal system protein YbgF